MYLLGHDMRRAAVGERARLTGSGAFDHLGVVRSPFDDAVEGVGVEALDLAIRYRRSVSSATL
ncbi:hypothetical protein ACFWWB_35590 [Streptomyces sp. NPDC058690]|uniref:hypothetical protein n=1 Tax=Streptomyces sp. NPDC058690 TaxID=3346600 RepID=UPI00365111EE